ncbi:hypothetical protein B0H66DRAFT_125250 [Apodospora peruviana]|uniref:Uncharacterized protein n=1 Tax=Apodospora peruviana TaxID=516989 RepID=A0AAE0II94_9PEZI|nr:hypothetical protein B0H66DRAFT_125250 [Apodospora peruviana]
MSSSANAFALPSELEGGGAGSLPQSPAPPAISPLTDPADPGNREPSVNVSLDHDQDVEMEMGYAPALSALQLQQSTNSATNVAANATAGAYMTEGYDHLMADGLPYSGDLAGLEPDRYDLQHHQTTTEILRSIAQTLLNHQQQQVPPPSTVRPSQVSLSLAQSLQNTSGNLAQAANPNHTGEMPVDSLESFARIEFQDSVFQMTTFAVIIGRDQRALQQARRDEHRQKAYEKRVFENQALGLPPPSPPSQEPRKFSKSYVSEEGGMLGPESDGDENPRPSKRRKTGNYDDSASANSQQQGAAAVEETREENQDLISNRQYVSHTPGAAAVNLDALRPDPKDVPFIGIHSPGPDIASKTKGISRQHLKIEFNHKRGVFEAFPLHKNGFFCEDILYKDDPVVLKCGDNLQIKDVRFTFIINGVPEGSTGAELFFHDDEVSTRKYSEGGKEMSFEFESSRDADKRSTSVEDGQVDAIKEDSESEVSDAGEEDADREEEDDNEVMDTIENDPEEPQQHENERHHNQAETDPGALPDLLNFPPKKRGPGRPPKNGIMSKREERLRKKAAMELAKKSMPPAPAGEPPVKRKVGRPRKHPLPEEGGDRPEKRKYKPRKSKTGEEGAEGSDAEKAVKERRREKPKTPPLELRREDYTEEQLQKPNKNYGVLIDEVLTAAPDGLTLKQIYKRIQMKYPFYYFTVDTKGWESSVRHNLIGNDAFKKYDDEHVWRRVPGIDIDAGKKRKAASPDHAASLHNFGQQHYQTPMAPQPTMFHGDHGSQQGFQPPHPNAGPQRPVYANHGQANPGQHLHQTQNLATPTAQVGVPAQPSLPRPAYPSHALTQKLPAAGVSGYGAPAAAIARPLQPDGTAATGYSSPYASKPPPPNVAQSGATPHSMARQLSQPVAAASPANGLPRVTSLSARPSAPGVTGSRPPQAAIPGGSTLPLEPAVDPELVKNVIQFKNLVTQNLEKRPGCTAPKLVAMSAINRGLGLSTQSLVPGQEATEDIVRGVFTQSNKSKGIHPDLLKELLTLKSTISKTLEKELGAPKSECLMLSAINRALGFVDESITRPGTEAEKQQFEKAENVLLNVFKKKLLAHQESVAKAKAAAAGIASAAPSPNPSARSTIATVTGPAQAPAQGSTQTPTQSPAQAHARAPTQPPVQAPVRAPTAAPAPVLALAQAPAQVSTPVQVPVQASVQASTPVPLQAQVQTSAPAVQAPASAPTPASGPAPAAVPAQTPVSAPAASSPPAQVPLPLAAPIVKAPEVITSSTAAPSLTQEPAGITTQIQDQTKTLSPLATASTAATGTSSSSTAAPIAVAAPEHTPGSISAGTSAPIAAAAPSPAHVAVSVPAEAGQTAGRS